MKQLEGFQRKARESRKATAESYEAESAPLHGILLAEEPGHQHAGQSTSQHIGREGAPGKPQSLELGALPRTLPPQRGQAQAIASQTTQAASDKNPGNVCHSYLVFAEKYTQLVRMSLI